MIKNLLLVAIRNLQRDRWYSLINIAGLMIGITFSLFLIFYIKDELGYDRYNVDADRIYRVNSFIKEAERKEDKNASTQYVLVPQLRTDYPEIEQATRLMSAGTRLFRNGTETLYEDKVYFADSNLFKVFTHPFLEGDARSALTDPNSLVLTESAAIKHFGSARGVVGKALVDDKGSQCKVTGVIKDVPANSHLVFHLLQSMSSLPKDFSNSWGNFGVYSYVLVKPNTDVAALEKKLTPLYSKFMAPVFEPYGVKIHYGLQSLTAIHLHSENGNEPEQLGSMSYIYIFSAIALFMVLIACINYMNLTTARSARRAKEIGIRKVTGSTRGLLMMQFLVESTLTTLIAMVGSAILIVTLLPVFNSLAGKSIELRSLLSASTVLIVLVILLLVGLLGGSYPAFYLSKFNPVSVLKGSLSSGASNVTLRRALVVVQFSIAMIMLISTLIVYKQLTFLRHVDLGFDQSQVVCLSANANKDLRTRIEAFVSDCRNNPAILAASTSQSVPGNGTNFNLFAIETKKGFVNEGLSCYGIDEHYLSALGMQVRAGRGFEGLGDTLRHVLVNEAMVKRFGWEQPIGKHIKDPDDKTGAGSEVIGVVRDFNQSSLYNPITPLVLFYQPNNRRIQLRIRAGEMNATLASVAREWKSIFPDLPFSYTFLDQDFNTQYAADQKRGTLFTTFSVLTILITCLGLLGLIAFTTEQRKKEISIRKVLGARVGDIVPMITRNFIALVGIATLIAAPIAALFMYQWLKLFAYNTGLTVSPFLWSVATLAGITLLTVIFHSLRAATANPVNGLKRE